MGYTIDYIGKFELDKPLSNEHYNFLVDFSLTRHFHRKWTDNEENGKWFTDPTGMMDPDWNDEEYKKILKSLNAKEREAYELNKWGCINYNKVNPGMPSFYCQWIPTEDKMGIEWDKGEKFYNGQNWLIYIINNYLKPWGYILNGGIEIRNGINEYSSDNGMLIVENNNVYFYPDEDDFIIDED